MPRQARGRADGAGGVPAPPARARAGARQTGIPLGGLIATAALPSLAHAAGWRWALVSRRRLLTVAFVLPLLRVELERTPTAGAGPSPGSDRDMRLLTLWGA